MACKGRTTVITLILLVGLLAAVSLYSIQEDIERHELENGATLILLSKAGAPVVSCITINDAGGVRENPGITGISHYLEHMAFKGTETIGTTDIKAEKKALQKCRDIFDKILKERNKGDSASEKKLRSLDEKLKKVIEKASKFAKVEEFTEILQLNGGRRLNAGTSQDMTMYSLSLPSNKLELWMIMEADRFTKPVFRDFYQERDVILEERRMIYGNPIRAFMDDFSAFAFTENPYRYSVIGKEEDIRNFTVRDLEEYFTEHYGAKNLVFAIVGDFDTKTALEMANKYLAKIPSGTKSPRVEFNEPQQNEERHFVSESQVQPFLIIGYPAPPHTHPDYSVYAVIADILGQGRSSRLHRSLVEEEKLASYAYSYTGYPGRAYDNLFIIGVMPNQGVAIEDCIAEVDRQLELMITEGITEAELQGVKKRALKTSYDRLWSDFGIAYQLAYYEAILGDYRLMFDELEKKEAVEKEDVYRIMKTLFNSNNRVVGELRTKEAE